jgi:arabinoxylan arabinofuranohydrolase
MFKNVSNHPLHTTALTLLMVFFPSIAIMAQEIAPDYKGASNGNPISASVFCADPTALEYNGRMYVYGTNDHQEFIANGKKGDNSYGNIKSIVVFSTDDMVNWTFHGTIDTKKICSSWGTSPWYKSYGVSWAPSVTWRTTANGTDEFFLYFCNSSHGIGVLKANSPIGPWTSPLKQLMIHYDTPGAFRQGTSANFDPGVVIDENGTGWIAFGGLNDNGALLPDNARIAKLKPSMTALDGAAVKIPAPYHFEANELNVINGKYVFTYCSHWGRNQSEWNTYKSEHGIKSNMPGGGTMCYMVSDSPLDPDSWTYKNYYGPGVAGNNHSHLQKYQGNYYHIYHDHGSVLLDAMKKGGAVNSSAGDYRSICVNRATVSEPTATINPVTLNLTGVTQLKNLDPYQLQQAETMASAGGVMYDDFKNIKTVPAKNTLGNDASENLYVKMAPGSWTSVRKVRFGANGAKSFILRAKGTGKLEIRLINRTSRASATLEFSATNFTDFTLDLDSTKFSGVRNVFFVFTEANNVQFDSWQFIENLPDYIENIKANDPKGTSHVYDLTGKTMQVISQKKGIYLIDGKKVMIR